MNYYNPYFFNPYSVASTAGSKSLFSGLFGKGLTFSSILNGTQKTLNIVNQAIPVVKQVTPMFKNMKTMFRVMSEFNNIDTPKPNKIIDTSDVKEVSKEDIKENVVYDNAPTFFQ